MKHIKLFESFDDDFEDDDVNIVYFYIEDGSKQAIVSLRKQGSSWREYVERGEEPFGFGSKTYQSYLKPSDLRSWLSKDYDYVEQIDSEDDFDNYLSEAKLADDDQPAATKKGSGDIRKDFTIDGKYIFDEKLSDDEQERLLMAKLDHIIQKKRINKQEADKVRKKWSEGIKKHGVKKFGSEIEQRYKKYDGGLVSDRVAALGKKIKGEIMKGYRQPLMQMFDDIYDVLAGNH